MKDRYEKFSSENTNIGQTVLCDRQMISSEELVYKGVIELIHGFTPETSCSEEVLKLQNQPGMEKIHFIVRDCLKWLISYKFQPDSNPYNLNDDEILAIGLYTFDIGLNGNQSDNLYFQLNKKLKDRNPQELSHYRGYLYYLQKALSKLPDISTTVYRGIPHLDIFQKNYTKFRQIHWSSFSSTTPTLSKAKEFAGREGCVLCINIFNGKAIPAYSVFPTEDEVLLSPNMSFVVTNPMYEKEGQHYIDLVQAKPEKTFVF
jgi:hypothetical protein